MSIQDDDAPRSVADEIGGATFPVDVEYWDTLALEADFVADRYKLSRGVAWVVCVLDGLFGVYDED